MLKIKMYQGLPSRIKQAFEKFIKENDYLRLEDIKLSQCQFRNDIVLTVIIKHRTKI